MARDLKVKKAEVSPGLSIDSPMVIFHVGSLDEIGDLPGVTGIDDGGGGTSSSGPSSRSGESGTTGEPPPREVFAGLCEATHAPDMPGVGPDGMWMGALHDMYNDALADAGAHDDGQAYVVMYVGEALIGPVKIH